jgi:hypothetical protein
MAHNPIHVVFDVEIDASGTVNVFTQAAATVSNVIWATEKLAKEVLYADASNAHIKFRGWSSSSPSQVDDLSGIRHNTFAATQNGLATAGNRLGAVLGGEFDCSGSKPFDTPAYKAVTEYHKYSSFGAAMLGAYAHYLFGHVQATAAIDNDQAFVDRMNGEGLTDAKVGSSLLAALDAMDGEKCTEVAKQVIGQDATRAMDTDNDMNSPNYYQALKFIADDVVYMRVKLLAPIVTAGVAQLGEPLASKYSDAITAGGTLANTLGIDVYTLRIVLV